MDPFIRKRGKSKAKQSNQKRYRIRFLCAHDMSAADCGPDGQGYIVEPEKEWQQWLRKCLPLIQVRLEAIRANHFVRPCAVPGQPFSLCVCTAKVHVVRRRQACWPHQAHIR